MHDVIRGARVLNIASVDIHCITELIAISTVTDVKSVDIDVGNLDYTI